jgi:hypothetical protein
VAKFHNKNLSNEVRGLVAMLKKLSSWLVASFIYIGCHGRPQFCERKNHAYTMHMCTKLPTTIAP